jgi:hypothetical protein
MHTIQYIAVQADDVDHAFRSVKDNLETLLGNDPESPTNTWFDWFVTGGGRWSTSEDSYDDNYQGDVVDQDSPKFQEYLDKAKEFRQTTLEDYLKQANEIDYTNLLSEIAAKPEDSFRGGMQLYPIKKIYDITMGTWNDNSYYYDVMNDSSSMVHLKNSIDNGADSWYLVPVDFHY